MGELRYDWGIDRHRQYFAGNSAEGFDWWIIEHSTMMSCHSELERMIEKESKTLSDGHDGCPSEDPSWFHMGSIVPYIRMGFLCNVMNLLCHGLVDVCQRLAAVLGRECPNLDKSGNQLKTIRNFIDNTCGIKISCPSLWNDIEALYKMRNFAVHKNGILPAPDEVDDNDKLLWEKDSRLVYLTDLLGRLTSVEFGEGYVNLGEQFACEVDAIMGSFLNELKVCCKKRVESLP